MIEVKIDKNDVEAAINVAELHKNWSSESG